MRALMMHFPLTLPHLLERSAKLFRHREIASRQADGVHRYSYGDFHARVHRLAHALASLGIQPGDRVATLCWNSHRHLELYWAVPCAGAILHALNLRLSDEQLAYIINHAGDRVIFADDSLLPILDRIRPLIPRVERIIVLPDAYEALLAAHPGEPYTWPALEETAACSTFYTSGTTGNPKGVVYDHRSVFLHTMSLAQVDVFGLSEDDVVLQVVQMFHANGWGVPYAAIMVGARYVLSGRWLQPEDIGGLIERERVTFTFGVPTLWMSLANWLEANPCDVGSVRCIVVAGSAMPKQFIDHYRRRHGIEIRCAWGMTEITPIATINKLPPDAPLAQRARHGRVSPGLEIRILDDRHREVPADGQTMGELQIRGAWVTSGYHELEGVETHDEGWFRTGDVATIDDGGFIQIMDRTKDLVKSGGEWISSVDLENLLMGHPKVLEAAVIAIPHARWEERPLACVVPAAEHRATITKEELIDYLRPHVAKWWLPDDIVFVEAVPRTSVGKFNKRALRQQFADFTWT